MRTRLQIGVLVTLAACAILDQRLTHAAAPVLTDVASAHSIDRSSDRAARATEVVHYDDAALTVLATYTVVDGRPRLVAPASGSAAVRVEAVAEARDDSTVRDGELWALVVRTLPSDAVATIRQLNVISDGRNGTLGMVHRSTVAVDDWVLSLDPAETDTVLHETLVHEYAHMLTLRQDDVQSTNASRSGCAGVRLTIGCARDGSALAAWHDEFWAGVAEPADADSRTFVSTYAASSVHEDLAESFLSWALDDIAKPSAAVKARYAFFEGRPQFVAARDAIVEASEKA